jgi:hypothetical protein
MRLVLKSMNRISLFSLLILVFFFSGCASTGFLMTKPEITMFGNSFPPKNEDETIDVYRTTLPTQEYIELAQIKCEDTEDSWNMQQILKEARKIGADGIIITGRTGSWGAVGSGLYASSEYGMTVIAIKYKINI